MKKEKDNSQGLCGGGSLFCGMPMCAQVGVTFGYHPTCLQHPPLPQHLPHTRPAAPARCHAHTTCHTATAHAHTPHTHTPRPTTPTFPTPHATDTPSPRCPGTCLCLGSPPTHPTHPPVPTCPVVGPFVSCRRHLFSGVNSVTACLPVFFMTCLISCVLNTLYWAEKKRKKKKKKGRIR